MWHVNGVKKRIVLVLLIDLLSPIYPTTDIIEGGSWTFVLSKV